MRWAWRRVFRRGSYAGDDEALNSGLKGRKSEDGCNAQVTRGEKARRKAEEKRQARLEKEMREEEERKQREEVARLVEEQRRLRDEKLKAERENEREAEIKRERETKREREAERKRQEKEKQLVKDKLQSDGKEAKKKPQENEKSGENGKREVLKMATFHVKDRKGAKNFRVYNTDAGQKINDQGTKGGCNNAFKVCSSRNIVPLKGSFQSPPKTSAWQANNIMPLFAKSSGLHSSVGEKSNKPTDSCDIGLSSDGNTSFGCNTLTPSTCSAWNRTDWGKSFGEGSDSITQNFSRQEINSPNRNGEKKYSTLEAQNLAANYACESPRIKQLQPPVGFQLQSSSPMLKKTNSLDPIFISLSTSCSAATSAVSGTSPKQEQIEVGNIPVPISEEPMFPPRTTMSLSCNSVPVYTSQQLNLDNTVLPHVSMSPDKSMLREFSSLQEHSAQGHVFRNMPVPESLKSSSLDFKANVISDIQIFDAPSPVSAPICVPIQRPAPIELPISKLLPSDIVDEVHAPGDQFPPISEPWHLQSLSLDCSNDAFKEFKWQMWNTPQLGQINLPNQVEHSRQPVVNGMYEQEKQFLSPCSERTLFSPFEPDTHLPSCLFSPEKNPNNLNQSKSDHIVGVSVSSNNSLWLNQPVYDSAEGSWNLSDRHEVQPSFSNGSTAGEMQDSVITTDCFSNDHISTSFGLESGMDGGNKSKWSAETASNNSCWSTTIKASTRPHVGAIYAPSHLESLWSYK